MSSLISLGKKAKEASYILGNLSSKDKYSFVIKNIEK